MGTHTAFRQEKDTVTSLELLEEINKFRQMEYEEKKAKGTLTKAEKKRGKAAKLMHSDLMKVIKNEFSEELNAGKNSCVKKTEVKIYVSEYEDQKGEMRPMIVMSLEYAKQVLIRESKFVRRGILQYINKLEKAIETMMSQPSYIPDGLWKTKLFYKSVPVMTIKQINDITGRNLGTFGSITREKVVLKGQELKEFLANNTSVGRNISNLSLYNKYGVFEIFENANEIDRHKEILIEYFGANAEINGHHTVENKAIGPDSVSVALKLLENITDREIKERISINILNKLGY